MRRDDYMVFALPEGDCNGLYVSRRDSQGFEVRELKGGTSMLSFTYRVVAKRKDIPGKRLERLDQQTAKNIATLRKELAGKASPKPGVLGTGGPDAGAHVLPEPPRREREEAPRGPR